MSHKKILHFDVADGTPNYDNGLGVYHAYNTNLKLMCPLHKVKKISLKSLEMPILFNNIRSENTSSVLYFQFTNMPYANMQIPIIIPSANYTSISALLSAINAQFATSLYGYNLTITMSYWFNPATGNYQAYVACNQSTAVWFFYKDSILLSSILGIPQTNRCYVVNSTTVLDGKYAYNINTDNYISLYLSNIPAASSSATGRNCSYKIPVAAVNSQIQFSGDNNQFGQVVEIQDSNLTISQLNICVYDRYGFPINGGNSNYSFSLLFEYDDLF